MHGQFKTPTCFVHWRRKRRTKAEREKGRIDRARRQIRAFIPYRRRAAKGRRSEADRALVADHADSFRLADGVLAKDAGIADSMGSTGGKKPVK